MNRKKIKNYIDALLDRHNIARFPIDLNKLAKIANAEIKLDNLDDDLSGFAYQKNGFKIIGVNKQHPRQRRRFTIAHELGHMFLHKQDTVNYDEASILLRLGHVSDNVDKKEIEANIFAAELLMPEEKIRSDVNRMGGVSLEDKSAIAELANRYKVSSQAMTIRLTTLYFS
ncbi:MAG TPA: ImmA/IrrE family metallo-endopeptidase [Candidatus Saccharimonadales bacterium]|nr:ImmA/IrrE family metallo-endopeptidase [Candidatus Saccharimonadales bacterium]